MTSLANVELDIHRAFDLLGLNMDGKSNSFVKVSLGAHQVTTGIKTGTLFPEWNQHFSFPSVPLPASLTINLFNKNDLFETEEPLGTSNFLLFDNAAESRKTVVLNHGGNRELAAKGLSGCGSLELSYVVGTSTTGVQNSTTASEIIPASLAAPSTVQQTPHTTSQPTSEENEGPKVPMQPAQAAPQIAQQTHIAPTATVTQVQSSTPELQSSEPSTLGALPVQKEMTSCTSSKPLSIQHASQQMTSSPAPKAIESTALAPDGGQMSNELTAQPAPAAKVVGADGTHPEERVSSSSVGLAHVNGSGLVSSNRSPEQVNEGVAQQRDTQRPITPSGALPLVITPVAQLNSVSSVSNTKQCSSGGLGDSTSVPYAKRSASGKPLKRATIPSKHKDPSALPNTSVVPSTNKIRSLYKDQDSILQAALAGSVSKFEQLRESDPLLSYGFLEVHDYAGRNCLHLAAWHGHLHVLETILKPMADGSQSRRPMFKYETQTSANGNTVLHSAALGGDLNTVAWLLQNARGIEVNIQAINKRGLTPLQAAREVGNAAVADLLAKYEPNHLKPVF